MSIASLFVIIGVVVSVIDLIKKSAKNADEKVTRNRGLNREYNNNLQTSSIDQVVYKKDTTTKKKKKTQMDEKKYTSQDSANYDINNHSYPMEVVDNSSGQKKNPFALTDNPVTNAIIASEILGKPKCRR